MSIITDVLVNIGSDFLSDRFKDFNDKDDEIKKEIEPVNKIEENDKEQKENLEVKSIRPGFGDGLDGEFTNLLLSINQSVVYLFIESKPTTHYNLVTVIVEDIRTNDWYPFTRPLSLQGKGGGWGNTRRFFSDFQLANEKGADAELSIRVVKDKDLKSLISGDITFQMLKERSIPAVISKDPHFRKLRKRFEKELLNEDK